MNETTLSTVHIPVAYGIAGNIPLPVKNKVRRKYHV